MTLKDEKRKRRFVRSGIRLIERVPLTNDQWLITLTCGHHTGVVQASRPGMVSAICPTCSEALQQKAKGA